MDNKTVTETKPEKTRFYQLEFRFLTRVERAPKGNTQIKIFEFKGDLEAARLRAREHCNVMGIRYIHCSPFIVDLDAQEKTKLKNPEYAGVDTD